MLQQRAKQFAQSIPDIQKLSYKHQECQIHKMLRMKWSPHVIGMKSQYFD